MALTFSTEKIQPKVMDRLDLLNAQEELNNAWMNLTDAQKNMEEVCEVMENIQTSVDLITKYGAAGVEQLNIDGSLEALCGVEAKLLTAEKAQEDLLYNMQDAWKRFVTSVRYIWDKIVYWFREKLLAPLVYAIRDLRDMRKNKATESMSLQPELKQVQIQRLEPSQKSDIEKTIDNIEKIVKNGEKISNRLNDAFKSIASSVYSNGDTNDIRQIIITDEYKWFINQAESLATKTVPDIPLSDRDEILERTKSFYETDEYLKIIENATRIINDGVSKSKSMLDNLDKEIDPKIDGNKLRDIREHLKAVSVACKDLLRSYNVCVRYVKILTAKLKAAK